MQDFDSEHGTDLATDEGREKVENWREKEQHLGPLLRAPEREIE